MVRFKRVLPIALCSLLLTTNVFPVYATGDKTQVSEIVDEKSIDSSIKESSVEVVGASDSDISTSTSNQNIIPLNSGSTDYSTICTKLPDGASVDAGTGVITLPNELGTLSLVDYTKDADGTVHLKDGSVISTDGIIVKGDGTVINADGTVNSGTETTTTLSVEVSTSNTVSLKFPLGSKLVESSTTKVKLPNDTVLNFEGCSIDSGTGSVTLADGTILENSGVVKFADGSTMNIDGTVERKIASLPFNYAEPEGNQGLFYNYSFNWNNDLQKYEFADLDGTTEYGFILGDGKKYKIVTYVESTGKYYSTFSDLVTKDDGLDYNILTLTEHSDIDSALSATQIVSERNSFKTLALDDAYVLFFKENAKSFNDLVYTVKFPNILNHIYEYTEEQKNVDTSKNNISVSVIKKIKRDNEVVGAQFKIDYIITPLSDTDKLDVLKVTDYGQKIMTGNGFTGSTTVTLNNLLNKSYTFELYSQSGSKATCDFKVDFITASNDEKPIDSKKEPIVTFTGQPSSKVDEGTEVILTMHTDNVKTMMNFNGEILGNGAYGKSFEVTVLENGTYHYSATTKGGKTVEGDLKVDYFNSVEEDSDFVDPIVNPLLGDDENGSTLTQTGMNFNIILVVSSFVLIVLGSLILLNKKYKFIGGIHRE